MTAGLSPWLGIDFGTCRSSASVLIGREPRTVSLGYGLDGGYDMPTAVYIEPDGSFLVGDEAVNARMRDTSRYFDRFKLSIGSEAGVTTMVHGASTHFAWRDLVAAVLSRIREIAATQYNNGRSLTNAVLTVPALYAKDGPQWRVMEQAAAQAGFSSVHIVREPHAAAVYYDHVLRGGGRALNGDGKVTLVYDLGGGTFDPALVRRHAQRYEIVGAVSGDDGVRCGGIFFDEKIRADFRAKFPAVAELFRPIARNPDGTISPEHVGRARRQAHDAIKLESFLLSVKHRFAAPGVREVNEPEPITFESDYRLTRAEFDALLEPLLETTIACCRALVKRTGIEWREIDRILMVGGSCHIPLVREKLARMAQESGIAEVEICWRTVPGTATLFDPLLAVSLGAALSLDSTAFRTIANAHRAVGDEAEALAWYRKAAEAGDADSQMTVAECLRTGTGIAASETDAVEWYERAAEQGVVGAQFALAEWLATTGGDDTNTQHRAAFWYERAATNGHSIAEYRIGERYLNGPGVEPDPEKSIHWLSKAAAHNVPEAENYLGRCHELGLGVERDPAKSAWWYLHAAQHGLAMGQRNIAICYNEGRGVPESPALAVDWLRRATAQDCAIAHNDLGEMLAVGRGTSVDAFEAAKHFRIAAEAGIPEAYVNLGLAYVDGNGVSRDLAEGVSWLRKGAECGLARAYYALGRCYETGTGVPIDATQEREWYLKGAQLGHAVSQNNAGVCLLSLEGQENAAMHWFVEAAKQDFLMAFQNLEFMLCAGRGNASNAVLWLTEEAHRGNVPAQKTLTSAAITSTLREVLSRVPNMHFYPSIDDEKIGNVRNVYSAFVSDDDRVLAVYDDTFFGGAKDGFIVTSSGIGARQWSTPAYWTFDSFNEEAFDTNVTNCCTGATLPFKPTIRAVLLNVSRKAALGWRQLRTLLPP